MADVPGVAAKVQGFLGALEVRAMLEEANHFSVRNGSARGFIRVWSPKPDDPDARTFVRFTVPLLTGVNDSPELYEYIAFHADDYILGHLSLFRTTEGDLRIFVTHELLGDYIDEAEFEVTLFGIMSTVDELDDQLQARFGGSRFHDES